MTARGPREEEGREGGIKQRGGLGEREGGRSAGRLGVVFAFGGPPDLDV